MTIGRGGCWEEKLALEELKSEGEVMTEAKLDTIGVLRAGVDGVANRAEEYWPGEKRLDGEGRFGGGKGRNWVEWGKEEEEETAFPRGTWELDEAAARLSTREDNMDWMVSSCDWVLDSLAAILPSKASSLASKALVDEVLEDL